MDSQPNEQQSSTKKGAAMLSKKRYQEIVDRLNILIADPDLTEQVLSTIKDVMDFDPNVSRYNPEVGKKNKEYRHRLRDEQGISTYITCGTKKRYEAMKVVNRCINNLCESQGCEEYNRFCIRCFVHMFPDNQVVKRYKTKEAAVVEFIKASFPDNVITFDKSVDGGCSRYRPDILIDCLTHSIIIEVDENQHASYDCTCENKRLMTLFQDLGSRPLVMIRFNPDGYMNLHGKNVKSCFIHTNKRGLPKVAHERHWNDRLNVLKTRIYYHTLHISEQEITVEHLFYDGFE